MLLAVVSPGMTAHLSAAGEPEAAGAGEKKSVPAEAKAVELPEIVHALPGEAPFNLEPMPTGETCGWLTERDWPDVKARLAEALGEGWVFEEAQGKDLDRMKKTKMFGDGELLGAAQVTHPGTDAWKFGVTLSRAPDGRRNLFSVVTFDKKQAEAAAELKKQDSPGFAALRLSEAAAAGDAEALEALFASYPGVPEKVAEWLTKEKKKLLEIARKGGTMQLLEQHTSGDCAIVLFKETNKNRPKSLDLDALYLHRQNGEWRANPMLTEWDFAAEIPEEHLPEQMKATEEQRKAFGHLDGVFKARANAIKARAKRRPSAGSKAR